MAAAAGLPASGGALALLCGEDLKVCSYEACFLKHAALTERRSGAMLAAR